MIEFPKFETLGYSDEGKWRHTKFHTGRTLTPETGVQNGHAGGHY